MEDIRESSINRHAFAESGNKYQIEKLSERHQEIARYDIVGYSRKDIAEMLGMSTSQVGNVQGSTIYQNLIDVLRSERHKSATNIAKQIDELAPMAMLRIREMLKPIYIEDIDDNGQVVQKVDDSIDPSLKHRVAQDVLNRAGYGAINRVLVGHISQDRLSEIRKDALKAGIEDGIIVEIDEEDMSDEAEEEDDATRQDGESTEQTEKEAS